MRKIIKDSHDMVYYISMLSTTGGKLKVSPKNILKKYNKNLNRFLSIFQTVVWKNEPQRKRGGMEYGSS